ncbi:hypothetical protein fugu_010035 [Takifugu bimaculatus]|uniref:Polypeptide N-acetylgalactosaminyltransferase n=1 Tax=Takifugu bimaculatus TaxID=433685 RepID=A0A4Z2CE55_9TELE|nr:hypothetical protein fugu_010035 [Takifugu bimaculatus]
MYRKDLCGGFFKGSSPSALIGRLRPRTGAQVEHVIQSGSAQVNEMNLFRKRAKETTNNNKGAPPNRGGGGGGSFGMICSNNQRRKKKNDHTRRRANTHRIAALPTRLRLHGSFQMDVRRIRCCATPAQTCTLACSEPRARAPTAASQLGPLAEGRTVRASKGNESCSSFQGRGVDVMRFLSCVCAHGMRQNSTLEAFPTCSVIMGRLRVLSLPGGPRHTAVRSLTAFSRKHGHRPEQKERPVIRSHRMRRFAYCKVVLATSLVWVMLDMFILLYFSECNKCDNIKERGLPGREDVLTRPRDGPGEGGKPVVIPKENQEKMKEMFKINQFNLMASEMIALNRSLPDVRLEGCKNKLYPDNLPRTSVVIVFHNEAWSTLLRTVHSVIDRSPHTLLEEIILVDDASERDFLKRPLEQYVRRLEVPVRVVITFLDAHCECTTGWLEPLLARIKKDRKTVVCPIIDVISDDTFEYMAGSDMTYGGFNWKLNFRWYPVPQREMDRRKGDRTLPVRTPTMAGGLFSIDRDYFQEIGTSGVSLTLCPQIWQCGGTLEIVTCSHVGHVFRKATPYTFPGGTGQIINKNNRRLAEVWMDEFKNFFYIISPGQNERKLRIRNVETNQCLDNMARKENEKVGIFNCHGMGGNQVFSYTANKEIRTDDLCLDVSKLNGPVMMLKCHHLKGNQLWDYDPVWLLRNVTLPEVF